MGSHFATTLQGTIYDFGSNNGDDIPYYLKKAEIVVAVEANPVLCEQIRLRFAAEISERRLFVENCVVTTTDDITLTPFYIHKQHDVLSQFPKPTGNQLNNFEKVLLPARSVSALLSQYGAPYYIKLDIENYNADILRGIFLDNVFPPHISAEVSNEGARVFSALVSLGNYKSFKLVDGKTVSVKYKDHAIRSKAGVEVYSFPYHSAGPFGDDLEGSWMNADDFLVLLAFEGPGWKDIHATNLFSNENAPDFLYYARRALLLDLYTSLKSIFPASFRQKVRRLRALRR